MNDFVVLGIVLAICVTVVTSFIAWLRTHGKVLLHNELIIESNRLRQTIAQARSLLREMPEMGEPEDVVTQGLSSLLPVLQNLDIKDIKDLIPAKYKMFLPVLEGFLAKMKKEGGGVTSKEQPFIGQGQM